VVTVRPTVYLEDEHPSDPTRRWLVMTLDDCTDYIILKTTEDGSNLNLLKLQKLVYYAQAWYLAFYDARLFEGTFEAWVHGPVSRDLYKRFVGAKMLYSTMSRTDMRPDFDPSTISPDHRLHIDNVLETYAGLTGTQLEELTHREDPWVKARGDLPPSASSQAPIDENLMKSYYRAQLS